MSAIKPEDYLPVVVTALTVLVLGCWNPKALQAKQGGRPTGQPSYLWLALLAFVVGVLCVLIYKSK